MRADRLVATLLILQARGRISATELASELEVSVKTARRDLEALALAGVPVYSQPGRNGGWRILGDARTDLTGLTANEARTLFLAAGASAAITADARAALRKLAQALPEPFRADAEAAAGAVVVDPTAWGTTDPPPPPEHLELLQRGVIERRKIRLGYEDRARTSTDRVIDPLGLVSKGTVWYLVAGTAHGLRTFRVSRVTSAVVLDAPADRPAGFDLTAAWRAVVATAGQWQHHVRATIRIPVEHVHGLRMQFGADMLLAEVDGPRADGIEEVIVAGPTALVIAQHLAGWGALVEVVEPDDVRVHLARIGAELVARHGSADVRGRHDE